MAADFDPSSSPDIPPEAIQAAQDSSRRLKHYVLVQQVGRGGMGAVWKAWDERLLRWVAVKFLLSPDERDTERFLREARLAARLRHPNIAVVHEVGEAPPAEPGLPGRQYLVMDFIDGETLASASLGPEQALRIFAAVARAVDLAHRQGVIHRDLKPQNILLSRERWPFVADFGLAKALSAGGSLSASGTVIGTPAYMPPEQALGQLNEIDERSDIYSLGATFYRVLAGQDPFPATAPLEILRRVVEQDPRPPRAVNPAIPAPVDTILRKCLSKAKAERYATALDLAEDVERALGGTSIRGRAPGPLALGFRRARRWAVSLLLSALLVAAVAALAWREWKSRGPQRPLPEDRPLARPRDDEADFRRAWRAALDAGRFRTAAALLRDHQARLDPAEAKTLSDEAALASRKFQDMAAREYYRALRLLASRANLEALSPDELSRTLSVPDLAELEDPAPEILWMQQTRTTLLDLRKGKDSAWDLFPSIEQADRLPDAGNGSALTALWPLFSDGLLELVTRETRDAVDLPREKRAACRARARAVVDRWRTLSAGRSAESRARHPEQEDLERDLERRASEFPRPLPELAEIDFAACLKSPDPEAECARARKRLSELGARTGIELEDPQKLLTLQVALAAQDRLLRGATEEDVARELQRDGDRLRTLGGAAAMDDLSPRLLRILDRVLRR